MNEFIEKSYIILNEGLEMSSYLYVTLGHQKENPPHLTNVNDCPINILV